MKRSHCWLWAALTILLFSAGCGTNPDATHLYKLEKLYYEAERAGSSAAIAAEAIGESERIRVAELYGEVAAYYQSIKSEFRGDQSSPEIQSATVIALQSSLRMAALLGVAGQPERAVAIYENLPGDYPQAPAFHNVARFELARLYERSRRLDSAFAIYHDLLYTHRPNSDTLTGYDMDWLRIPLHIAEIYGNLEMVDLSGEWLDTAETFYVRIQEELGEGTVSTMSRMYLATAYRLRGKFREAIAAYRTTVDTLGRIMPQAQVEIGNLFYEEFRMADSALVVFKDLVAERPDSRPATIAQTKIAGIYIDQGKFQEARELLRPLKEAYEKKGQLVAGIMLLIGRSYEVEGAWDRALNEYSWLTENFPNLPQSMEIMLHVMSKMVQRDNMSVARQWHRNSKTSLERTVTENPGTELAAIAQTTLARSFAIMKKWPEAAEAYRELIDTYPPLPSRLRAYLELSSVYAEELDQPAEGAAVLEKLLNDFPGFRRSAEIQERIDHLKSLTS